MKRRALLTTIAALGIAGCSSNDRPATDTPAGTTAETTSTATSTPTDTATQAPTETDTPEPTETETDTPEETPDLGAQARPHIEGARAELRRAYNRYLNQAEDADSLTDVTVYVEFESSSVGDRLDRTDIRIQNARASRPTEEQQATLDNFTAFRESLEAFAEVQEDLGRGPDHIEDIDESFFGEQLDVLDTAASDFADASDAAQEELDEFDGEWLNASPADSLDWLGTSEVVDKHDQLQSDTDELDRLGTAVDGLSSGIAHFDRANEAGYNDNWSYATRTYEEAREAFADAEGDLSLVDFSGPLADQIAAISDGLGPLAAGLADLATAAAAYADGDDTQGDRAARDARDHFFENSEVRDMTAVEGAPDGI